MKKNVSKRNIFKEGKVMRKFLMSSVCVLTLGVSGAHAQSMDYGSLQELFGEPVTTSANGSPMRQSDVPMDMTIISRDDIAKYPAREIPDILRHYAGVSVRQNGATDYSVGLRGYNQPGAERILVLVNGRQVYQDYYGLVNWSAIPVQIDEIQQIEIVKGPNTALFGFNAISGVVNIVTLHPIYDDLDQVQVTGGMNMFHQGNGVYTLQEEGKWGLRVSGSFSSIDDEDRVTPNPAEVGNVPFRDTSISQDFNADLAVNLNDSTQMRFEGSVGNARENIMTAFYDGGVRDEKFQGIKATVSSDTDYGIIEATLYNNSSESTYYGATTNFLFDNVVTVAQISDTFKIGTDHTFRIAGEYRDNQVDHTLGTTVLGTTALHISSLSGLWYWNATDALSTSLAVRYDHVQADFDPSAVAQVAFAANNGLLTGNPFSNDEYNNRYDEFGYNFGLAYKVTDVDTIRFTAAKGVDLPSGFELGVQATNIAFGDPNTDVSDVHDFQIGYERSVADINGSVKVNTFYQRINELQGFAARNRTASATTTGGIGDSEAYGIDLTVEGETESNIRWGVNYTYTRVDDDISTSLDYEDLNSEHMVNAHIGYSPNEQWDYDLFASYESSFTSERNFNTTNTYPDISPDVILDARIAYKPADKWTVSLNGQALLGDNEQSSYGANSDTQLFLRAKYDF